MNWDDVRYFLAIARAGSYVGAADELGVSHTTVSRRIQAFEGSLGARLVERLPDGLGLTAAGERMLQAAQSSEREFLAAERQIAGRDTRLFGSLRVTVPYLLADHLLMRHFAAFAAVHPDIELQIIAAPTLVSLTRREADVAIRVTNQPPESAVGRRVAVLCWALYVSETLHRTCRDNAVPVPFIGLDDDAQVPDWYAECFPGARLRARVNDHALLVEAVRAGMGAAVLARFVGDREPGLRRVMDLPDRDVGLWLLTHAEIRSAARVRVFLDTMHEVLAKELAEASPRAG
ncbi:MAG: LysR family transcriptional regulator [Proteobacteria bacterium]|nr:LysR family transcriptional regulator [Pseudomonadota bacterium]